MEEKRITVEIWGDRHTIPENQLSQAINTAYEMIGVAEKSGISREEAEERLSLSVMDAPGGVTIRSDPTQKTMIVFIGIQASGKTTYYKRHFADSYVHINLDTLHTRSAEKRLLAECFANGKSFVVDNTNPTKADRARYIPLAKAEGYRVIGCFFESKIKDCIARNEQRTGTARVPAAAIAATSNRLELPCRDEGFDALYFVAHTADGGTVMSEWRDI